MRECWRPWFTSGSIQGAMSGPSTWCSKRSDESFQRFATSRWSRMRSASTAVRCRPLPCRSPRWPQASPGSPAAEALMRSAPRRRGGSWTLASRRQISWREGRFDTTASCVAPRPASPRVARKESMRRAAGAGDWRCRQGRRRHQAGRGGRRFPFCSALRRGPNTSLKANSPAMRTWRGVKVGAVGPSPALKAAVLALPRQNVAAAAPR